MIDKKTIEEAAARKCNPSVGGLANTTERIAFAAGVDWFKHAIWHDRDEEPEEGEQILYLVTEEDEIVDAKVTITALYDFIPWSEVVSNFGISVWCYLSDLLPTK